MLSLNALKNLLLIPFVLLLLQASCFAAALPEAKGGITKVSADKMVYDALKNMVTFTGNVKVNQPEFDLTSKQLVLYLEPSTKKAGTNKNNGTGSSPATAMNAGKVKTVVAEKNVVINLPQGRIATCEKATYTLETETVLMEQNPVLREGNSLIRGRTMVFYLKDERNEVRGDVQVEFVNN